MKNKKKFIYIFAIIYLVWFGFQTIVLADTTSAVTTTNMNCDSWGDAKQDLQNVFNFCKIIVPLLVIGLSTYDFIKAITGKNDKDIKKAFTTLIKRLALAVVFFFLPIILNLLLELVGTNSDVCIN